MTSFFAGTLAGTRGGLRPAVLAMGAGLLLLLGAAWLWFRTMQAAPPYQYVMDGADQAVAESVQASTGALPLQAGRVVAQGQDMVLARFATVESATGPVLMRWQPAVDSPFLHMQPGLDDVTALAEVLGRHVAPDTPVLAWWDVSRQLSLLANVRTVFGAPLGEPLFVPDAWRAWQRQVRSVETAFWGMSDVDAERLRFDRFAGALLQDQDTGMAALRELVQGRAAVLVLHVRDIIQLGHMQPDRIGVAFREFPDSGDVHGMVRGVRAWLSEHDYAAYALMRTQDQPLRAIALMDDASGMTLAARLLPFIGNAQYDVPGATLVYQVGGFSVYEIAASSGQGGG